MGVSFRGAKTRKVIAAVAALVVITSACGSGSSSSSDSTAKVKNGALVRPTCDAAAPCKLGGEGKGGGTIFYYSATPFRCGANQALTCNMLEYAPANWAYVGTSTPGCVEVAVNADKSCPWSTMTSYPAVASFKSGIGAGYDNTNLVRLFPSVTVPTIPSTVQAVPAANATRQYTGSTSRTSYYLQDWYLPTLAEATQLCKYANGNVLSASTCTRGTLKAGFGTGDYWTSDPLKSPNLGTTINFGTATSSSLSVGNQALVRPIRAFMGVIDPSSVPTTIATTTTLAPTTTVSLTCATGGACSVGNTGPGGGLIFYVAATPFKCGATMTQTCKYLEVAPSDATPSDGALPNGAVTTSDAIGAGAQNTAALAKLSSSNIATQVQAYRGGGKSDWFIGSKGEVNEWCKSVRIGPTATGKGDPTAMCRAGFTSGGIQQIDKFWSSTVDSATTGVAFDFHTGWISEVRPEGMKIRMMRAF